MMRIALALVSIAVFLSGCENESDDSAEGVVSNATATSASPPDVTAGPDVSATTVPGGDDNFPLFTAPAVTTISATTVATTPNIVGLASSVDSLSTLVTAVTAAELVYTLTNAEAKFTVFAPNNAAFAMIQNQVTELLKPENKADLVDVLTFHVLSVQVLSTDLQAEQKVTTLQGEDLTVTKTDDGVGVHDTTGMSSVLTADQMASNGVAHIIDRVLMPTPNVVGLAKSKVDLSTLVAAIVAAELVDTLSAEGATYTVFAPNNGAFDKIKTQVDELLKPENKADLVNVLTYHVLPVKVLSTDLQVGSYPVTTVQGQNVTVIKTDNFVQASSGRGNAASVTQADQMATNGVVHIVDNVLMPAPNIVGLAQSVDDLSTLVTAIVAADLVETLSTAGATFTVFAPMNAAFAAINSTVQELLKPENKAALVDLLKYHVLPVQVLSTDLAEGVTEVATVQGQMLRVTKNGATVKVGSGEFDVNDVTAPDQMAANGVVHIINGVLQPPTVTTTGTAASP